MAIGVVWGVAVLHCLARFRVRALLEDLFDDSLISEPVPEVVVARGRAHGNAAALAVADSVESFLDVVETAEAEWVS